MSSMRMMYREEDRARLEIALGVPVGQKLFAVSVSVGLAGQSSGFGTERHKVMFVMAENEDEAFSILNNHHYDDFHRGFFRCLAVADVVESNHDVIGRQKW